MCKPWQCDERCLHLAVAQTGHQYRSNQPHGKTQAQRHFDEPDLGELVVVLRRASEAGLVLVVVDAMLALANPPDAAEGVQEDKLEADLAGVAHQHHAVQRLPEHRQLPREHAEDEHVEGGHFSERELGCLEYLRDKLGMFAGAATTSEGNSGGKHDHTQFSFRRP